MAAKRDYRKEYDDYYGKKAHPSTWTDLQKQHRKEKTARNRAHRIMTKETGVGKNYDVDHKDCNPRNNDKKNLRVVSVKTNRGTSAQKCKKLKQKK